MPKPSNRVVRLFAACAWCAKRPRRSVRQQVRARARAADARRGRRAQAMAAGELRAATVLGVVVPLLQQMIVEGRLAPFLVVLTLMIGFAALPPRRCAAAGWRTKTRTI